MNPNLLILIIGAVDVIMGVSIFFMAGTITSQAFIPSLINNESLLVGTLMHEAVASQIIAIGIILLFLKDVSFEVAKKVLLGAGVAIAIGLLSAIRHYFMPEVSPPLPAIIFQALLMIAAFYVSQTAKEN